MKIISQDLMSEVSGKVIEHMGPEITNMAALYGIQKGVDSAVLLNFAMSMICYEICNGKLILKKKGE